MHENEIAKEVVDAAFKVHSHFGPGLFEIVYEVSLEYELKRRGLKVARQVPIPIRYEGVVFEEGFRADAIVEDKLLLELKSIEEISRVHKKQVLTYLRLLDLRLGLLVNFGEEYIKDGISRIVNRLVE